MLISLSLLLLLRLAGPVSQAHALATCYGMEGDQMNSNYVPCNQSSAGNANDGNDGAHSTCCNAANVDICLSSGLCLSTVALALGRVLWVNGCTDKTLKDPSCPQYCRSLKNDAADAYFLRSCDRNETVNTWCCGVDGQNITECCSRSFKLRSNIGHAVQQLSLSGGININGANVNNGLPFNSPSSTPAPYTSNGNGSGNGNDNGSGSGSGNTTSSTPGREGLIVGISVVSAIAAIAIIALALALLRIRLLSGRNNRALAAPDDDTAAGDAPQAVEHQAEPPVLSNNAHPEAANIAPSHELSPLNARTGGSGTGAAEELGAPELDGTGPREGAVIAELPEDTVASDK